MNENPENFWDGIPIVARSALSPETCGVSEAVFLDRENIRAAATRLMENGFHLEDITGLDFAEGIEVRYHFSTEKTLSRVVLRVLVNREHPEVPSIFDIVPAAEWHERECFDFYGVKFFGHPRLRPILLPADLGFNPLIKEEKARQSLYSLMEGYPALGPARGEMYIFEASEGEGENRQ